MQEFSAQIVLYDKAVDLSAFRAELIAMLTDLKEQGLVGDFVLKSTAPAKVTR